MNKNSHENRREFFSKFSKGLAGITMLTVIPAKLFGRSQKGLRNIKVKIHDNAVKRIK